MASSRGPASARVALTLALIAIGWLGTPTPADGQDVASLTGCTLSPGDYERAGYTIRRVDVRHVFDFLRVLSPFNDQANLQFPQAGTPFRVKDATDAAAALRNVLANRPEENESPLAVTVVVDFIDNCTDRKDVDAGGQGQLDLVYRAVTNRIPLFSGLTFESRQAQADDGPREVGAISDSELVRVAPRFGYTRSDGFQMGGQVSLHANGGIFDSVAIDGLGSSSSHLVRGSLSGSHDSGSAIARSEWRLSWSDSERPTDDAGLFERRVSGQMSGQTRPFGAAGSVFRFGASMEDGDQRTELSPNVPGARGLAETDYSAVRTYAGLSLNTPRHTLTGSYGLLLGHVPDGNVVDYRKHIVDAAYALRQKVGDHRTLEVESRFSAGWLQMPDRAPAVERFYGGNVQQNFIEGDAWHIRANPFIRSMPNGFLNHLSAAPGTGGENFFSVNLTVSLPVWRLPLVPSEVSQLMGFKEAMEETKGTARQQASSYYRSKDPAQKKIEGSVPAVSAALKTLLTQLQAILPGASGPLRQQIADCSDAVDLAQDKMQHLSETGFGPIASIIVPDVLSACDAIVNGRLNDPVVTSESKRLAVLRDSISAIAAEFDEAGIQAKVESDLGFAFRAFDTFIGEVNVVSLAPVVLFDAARIGPQPDSLGGGVRYGIGGGLRVSVMNLMNITAGYAVNPSPKPWETRGAFFLSLDLIDLFR